MTTTSRSLAAAALITAATLLAIPAEANEWTAADGAWALYKKNCAGCHGFKGQGIVPAGTPLMGNVLVTNAPAEILKQVIRNGRKGAAKSYGEYMQDGKVGYMSMPAFEAEVISDTELELLVNYLKGGFQKGQFNQ